MPEQLIVPKLGQTVEEVTIGDWLVPDGTEVSVGQEVLNVETDKATYAVESTAAGFIHFGPVEVGDIVPVFTVVAVIGAQNDVFAAGDAATQTEIATVAQETAPESSPAATTSPAAIPQTAVAAGNGERVFASPRARALAAKKGVDLAEVTATGPGGDRIIERDVLAYLEDRPKVTPVARRLAAEAGLDVMELSGSGPGGRITRRDVEAATRPAGPAVAPVPAAALTPPAILPPAEVSERVPLKGIRGIIADRMATSVHTTARVTLVMEIDATEFVAARERLKAAVTEHWGFAPGFNDLLAKIVASALRQHPYMNARLTADAIEHLSAINMGMAVDTERGLMVPVIQDADQKGLRQFGLEFRDLAERARSGKILPDELSGGTFTITSLGMFDIDAFTPVINLPEAAILGVGRIMPKAVVRDGEIVARQMWTLSLVFDHRLVDGAPAARFLQTIKRTIEEPLLLLAS
ncbi:MAG: 2-oxo acid dehydrogenase subunit E2 [Caldilineales bacterium]|nr:2-oxo acid dehydrogenase subunit E2 [Caldilineales bacterium]